MLNRSTVARSQFEQSGQHTNMPRLVPLWHHRSTTNGRGHTERAQSNHTRLAIHSKGWQEAPFEDVPESPHKATQHGLDSGRAHRVP
eukprot:15473443-Alexandrium_andersonii.AAC.1